MTGIGLIFYQINKRGSPSKEKIWLTIVCFCVTEWKYWSKDSVTDGTTSRCCRRRRCSCVHHICHGGEQQTRIFWEWSTSSRNIAHPIEGQPWSLAERCLEIAWCGQKLEWSTRSSPSHAECRTISQPPSDRSFGRSTERRSIHLGIWSPHELRLESYQFSPICSQTDGRDSRLDPHRER